MARLTLILTVVFAASVTQAAITDDLVLGLHYDESGGVVTPEWVNGNDGVLFKQNSGDAGGNWVLPDGSVWVPGKWGNAVRFYGDDVGHKVMDTHVLAQDSYSGTQDWSYSFWVRRPTDRHIGWGSSWVNQWSLDENEGYTAGDEFSVNWWDWNGGLEYDHLHTRYDEWANAPEVGRNLNLGFNAGGAWEKHNLGYALGQEWGDGEWHNIIIMADGDPAAGETQRWTTSVYVDGVQVALLEESGWGWGNMPMEAFTVAAPQSLKGIDINDEVDEIGVWTRLLTADDIAYLQVNPIPEPASLMLLALGGLWLTRRR